MRAHWIIVPVLIVIVCGAAPCPSTAQSTFMRMYASGNEGRSVREVGGAYTVGGGTDFYANWHWLTLSPTANTRMHLFKTDVGGNLLWEKSYGQVGSRMTCVWMEAAPDGGYILAGNRNTDRAWPPDSSDVLLVKTDANGTIEWSKLFDTGKDEIAHCVRGTSDGGYILSGFHDALPVSPVGNTHVLLLKLDGAGIMQWAKKYPFAVRDFVTGEPFTYVARQLADDGYAIAGTTVGAGALGVYVIRTDPNGLVLWAKVIEHDASIVRYSVGLDILETSAGDLIIAGAMDKSRPAQTNHPYWLQLSGSGALLDAQFYETNPPFMFQSGFSSVIGTSDGGYFFTGMGGYSDFGDQAQLLKTDTDLNEEWSRVYTWDGIATMGARSGRETADGGYVFTGKRQVAGTVLLKTDALGLIPCKDPGTLVAFTPSLLVQDLSPSPLSGITVNDVTLTTTAPMLSATEICPEILPLPVELVSFTAAALPAHEVSVQWVTATENGSDHFVLERSADAISFEQIAWIEGAGNSVTAITYSFTDTGPLSSGVSYYRLAQVDLDGTTEYSNVVAVVFSGGALALTTARADRIAEVLNVQVRDDRIEPLTHTCLDVLGRVVSMGTHISEDGIVIITIDAHGFAAGTYMIAISNGARLVTGRVSY